MKNDYLKNIPSIQKISEQKRFEEFTKLFSRKIVINKLRILLDQYRDAKNSALNITMEMIFENLQTNLNDLTDDHPKQIINVSGVILQTNFGRAPLSKQAIKTSGILNPPPISTDSDLDTNTSLLLQIALNAKKTAAALLLITNAFSALVSLFIIFLNFFNLPPRLFSSKSYSKLE